MGHSFEEGGKVKEKTSSSNWNWNLKMVVASSILTGILAYFSLSRDSSPATGNVRYDGEGHVLDSRDCPDYTTWSMVPHGSRSEGPLQLPFMRPSPECRTFNSTSVEVCDPFALGDVIRASTSSIASYHGHESAYQESRSRPTF